MDEKLRAIEARFEHLAAELADPELIADRVRYQEATRAYSEIEPVVEVIRAKRKTLEGLASARQMLDEAVEVLKVNPDVNVEVQGHTDNVGDPDYNVGLSERRANAVRDYMISKGIPSSRLRAKGYGMTRPHFSNDSEQGRALNRRVELHPYR